MSSAQRCNIFFLLGEDVLNTGTQLAIQYMNPLFIQVIVN
jgi:hypothetical protein